MRDLGEQACAGGHWKQKIGRIRLLFLKRSPRHLVNKRLRG